MITKNGIEIQHLINNTNIKRDNLEKFIIDVVEKQADELINKNNFDVFVYNGSVSDYVIEKTDNLKSVETKIKEFVFNNCLTEECIKNVLINLSKLHYYNNKDISSNKKIIMIHIICTLLLRVVKKRNYFLEEKHMKNRIFNIQYNDKEQIEQIETFLKDNNVNYSSNEYSYKDNYILSELNFLLEDIIFDDYPEVLNELQNHECYDSAISEIVEYISNNHSISVEDYIDDFMFNKIDIHEDIAKILKEYI